MSINGIPNAYKDFFVEVQQGNVPGHSMVHKFGRSINIPNGAWALVSSTDIAATFPSSTSPVRIKAGGNAADTFDGSGTREVIVVGIDENLQQIVEAIVTSGASASAPTTASFWRVHQAYSSKVGTYGTANIGNIVIEDSGGVADLLTAVSGEGQTRHGSYSIPSGKTGYLLNMHLQADAGKAADFRMFVRSNLTDVVAPMSSKRLVRYFDGVIGQVIYETRSSNLLLPALSDIWIEARGGGANTEVSVDFEILLVDDDPGHIV